MSNSERLNSPIGPLSSYWADRTAVCGGSQNVATGNGFIGAGASPAETLAHLTQRRERLVLAYLRGACTAQALLDAFEEERVALRTALDDALALLESKRLASDNEHEGESR
jgi:hypothetical protein